MRSLEDVLTVIASMREDLARRGVRRIGVFGSVARGTQRPDSDVDVLVDLEPGSSLLDLVAIRRMLSEALGCPVDVASRRGLRPEIEQSVLEDVHDAA